MAQKPWFEVAAVAVGWVAQGGVFGQSVKVIVKGGDDLYLGLLTFFNDIPRLVPMVLVARMTASSPISALTMARAVVVSGASNRFIRIAVQPVQ